MPPDTHKATGSASEPTPERGVANSLSAATLLAFAGGSLDAFLYLQHGRVFAGAMTGNAVLCGIALLGGNRFEALRHLLPLLGFVCGVTLAELLQERLKPHAVTIGLLGEIVGLLVASFLPPGFPDLLFVPLIAVVAAYQIASFRKVDDYSYNSTFITGDLRTAVVGLYKALHPSSRREGMRQARDLGLIVACFLTGAVTGALFSSHLGNHTLWVPIVALSLALGMAVRALGKEAPERTASPSF